MTPVPTPTPEFPGESAAPPANPSHHGAKNGKKGTKQASPGGVGASPGAGAGEPPSGAAGAIPEEGSTIEPQNGEATAVGVPADEPGSGSGGSVLGSIIAGLVAGGVLFAIGYGPYRRWQATRSRPPAQSPPTAAPPSPPRPPHSA